MLVLSILNYGSIIWTPYKMERIRHLDEPLHIFLRHLLYRAQADARRLNYSDHDYDQVMEFSGLRKTKSGHDAADIITAWNIIAGKIDCPTLRETFIVRPQPYNLRVRWLIQEHLYPRTSAFILHLIG